MIPTVIAPLCSSFEKNNKGKFDGLDFSPWFTCVCCPFRVRCSRDFLLVGMCADCIGLIEKLADYTFGIIRPQRATNLYSLTTILLSGAQTILTELWIRAVGHDKNENVCFNLISNRVANVQAPETPAGGLMWPIAIIICHWARAVGETDRVCSVPRDWAVVWACVCAYFVDCSSCQLVQNWRRDVIFVCVWLFLLLIFVSTLILLCYNYCNAWFLFSISRYRINKQWNKAFVELLFNLLYIELVAHDFFFREKGNTHSCWFRPRCSSLNFFARFQSISIPNGGGWTGELRNGLFAKA